MDLIDRGSGRMGLSAAVPPRGGRVKVLLHEVRWASATGKGAITRPAHPPRRRRKPEVRGREAARVESLHSRTSQAVTGDAAGSPVLPARAVPPIWLMGLRSSPHKQQRYRFTPSHQDSLGIGAFHEKNHTSRNFSK